MTKPTRLRSFAADTREADKDRGKSCRQCRAPLPPRRRAYCSDECRRAFLIPCVWSVARAAVIQRDKGVCAACGRDAAALLNRFWKLKMLRGHSDPAVVESAEAERRALILELNREGFALRQYTVYPDEGELFQVDHITPVAEGGGGADLSGLQTLCTACHKKKTKEQAKRKAVRRRPQMALPIEEA